MSSPLIEQIQLQYKQSLKTKAITLSSLYNSSQDNQEELLSFLHQLAGSAGLYGYEDITEYAQKLTHLIQNTQSLNESYSLFEYLNHSLIKNSEQAG